MPAIYDDDDPCMQHQKMFHFKPHNHTRVMLRFNRGRKTRRKTVCPSAEEMQRHTYAENFPQTHINFLQKCMLLKLLPPVLWCCFSRVDGYNAPSWWPGEKHEEICNKYGKVFLDATLSINFELPDQLTEFCSGMSQDYIYFKYSLWHISFCDRQTHTLRSVLTQSHLGFVPSKALSDFPAGALRSSSPP